MYTIYDADNTSCAFDTESQMEADFWASLGYTVIDWNFMVTTGD